MEEAFMQRTATCGSLRAADEGKTVVLNGWVHRDRNHGALHFINLRDRYGMTQVVVDDDASEELQKAAGELKLEYCIAVKGIVRRRPDDMINPDMATGEIEVKAERIDVLSKCDVLPFMIDEENNAREDLRLKYRYLDLRCSGMQKRIALRHEIVKAIREYFYKTDFLEIETPTLIRSTPEGARDFLVPSRIYQGLPCPLKDISREVLRAAAVPAALQAASHGLRLRQVLPDSEMLQGRGSARRQAA